MRALIGVVATIILLICALLWFLRDKEEADEPKHSEVVTQLMATVDSVYTLKRIPYSKGNVFLELMEDKDFGGVKLRERLSSGDTTIIIKHPISIKHIEVTPESSVTVKYLNEDSTRCFLSFEKELGDEKVVTVMLRGEEPYLYILPLLETEPTTPNRKDATNQEVTDKKPGNVVEQEYDVNSNEDGQTPENAEASRTEYTIDINGSQENQKITLWSKRGTNTKAELFFHEYAFSETGENDYGWYSVKNNGYQCVITIKNTTHDPIPSTARNAVIYVQTQPSCNEGKGIILRIRKLNQT